MDLTWTVSTEFKLPGGSVGGGLEVTGSAIWSVGGYSHTDGLIGTLHQFDLGTGMWREMFYALGGYGTDGSLNSAEVNTPGMTGVTRHQVSDMLHRRSNFFAVLVDPNTIMVVGGLSTLEEMCSH